MTGLNGHQTSINGVSLLIPRGDHETWITCTCGFERLLETPRQVRTATVDHLIDAQAEDEGGGMVQDWQILTAALEYPAGITKEGLKAMYAWWFGEPDWVRLEDGIQAMHDAGYLATRWCDSKLEVTAAGEAHLAAINSLLQAAS